MINKKYQINYAVQSMLAVVGIVLLLIFYKMSYINTGLLTAIPADLAKYIIFIGALIALVLLLLFELILLVISKLKRVRFRALLKPQDLFCRLCLWFHS